ncbi:MAG: P-loop NTPase [Fusobacteria bacterium]|nr:P-loop NTPase [Fusobacteriota bacterium]
MSNGMKQLEQRVKDNISKIKHKIVIMSGKGGVGKSTISTNIAYGLALEGKKVGLLDVDLHGPNIPIMMGLEGQKMSSFDEPFLAHENLKVISLSFFLQNSEDPIVWRGPAKIGAIRQLIGDVKWGELDYLVVDLPPGTGDEPLTIAQDLGKIDGSVIVTTPQEVALLDLRKSIKFSNLVNMPIMGIVENMSGFVCPNCNEVTEIFKTGGANKIAKEYRLDVLGKIPLNPEIMIAGDTGKPFIYFNSSSIEAKELQKIVNQIIEKSENKENEKNKETNEKSDIIKIAFPTNDRVTVEDHFGHCKEFAIFDVKNGNILEKNFITAPPHEPGLLPVFLGEKNVNVIITGGMGQKAIDLFKERDVDVILGASGDIESNLNEYLKGELYSGNSTCNHGEGEGCNH